MRLGQNEGGDFFVVLVKQKCMYIHVQRESNFSAACCKVGDKSESVRLREDARQSHTQNASYCTPLDAR